MPELPEVETIARSLRKRMIGRTIITARLFCPKLQRENPPDFSSRVAGSTVQSIQRKGKHLIFLLSDGWAFWVHLMMTGHLFLLQKSHPLVKADRAVFKLSGGLELRFHDIRRFGHLRLVRQQAIGNLKEYRRLGPDALFVSEEEFCSRLRSRKRQMKPALLDQTLLAGLGNIYADEALFAARIHPLTRTDRLSRPQLRKLWSEIRRLLTRAIHLRGTSVYSYTDTDGRRGKYQEKLKVYGQENAPCPRCRAEVKRLVIGQRSSHFCPRCQKRGA